MQLVLPKFQAKAWGEDDMVSHCQSLKHVYVPPLHALPAEDRLQVLGSGEVGHCRRHLHADLQMVRHC